MKVVALKKCRRADFWPLSMVWRPVTRWNSSPSWTRQADSEVPCTVVDDNDGGGAIKITNSNRWSTRRIPHLPLELVEHIINHLFDDKATLTSCALVARSWLEPAHYHLFSSIRHDLHAYPWRTSNLGSFLILTPHRAKYVRELDFRKVIDGECESEFSKSHKPVVYSRFMVSLLSSLPNLTTLNLATIPFSGEKDAFESLPPMTKMRSFAMSCCCTLSHITIVHILRAFPNLQYLCLEDIGTPEAEHDLEVVRPPLSELPSLPLIDLQLLGWNEDIWQLVHLCCIGQQTLRRVSFQCWDEQEYDIVRSLIKLHHSYLTEISLDISRVNINRE